MSEFLFGQSKGCTKQYSNTATQQYRQLPEGRGDAVRGAACVYLGKHPVLPQEQLELRPLCVNESHVALCVSVSEGRETRNMDAWTAQGCGKLEVHAEQHGGLRGQHLDKAEQAMPRTPESPPCCSQPPPPKEKTKIQVKARFSARMCGAFWCFFGGVGVVYAGRKCHCCHGLTQVWNQKMVTSWSHTPFGDSTRGKQKWGHTLFDDVFSVAVYIISQDVKLLK